MNAKHASKQRKNLQDQTLEGGEKYEIYAAPSLKDAFSSPSGQNGVKGVGDE